METPKLRDACGFLEHPPNLEVGFQPSFGQMAAGGGGRRKLYVLPSTWCQRCSDFLVTVFFDPLSKAKLRVPWIRCRTRGPLDFRAVSRVRRDSGVNLLTLAMVRVQELDFPVTAVGTRWLCPLDRDSQRVAALRETRHTFRLVTFGYLAYSNRATPKRVYAR